jgi:hypothetical protein
MVSAGKVRLFVRKMRVLRDSWVFETNATQLLGIALMRIEANEFDQLIANQSGAGVDGLRIHAPCVHATFGPRYEEAAGPMQCMQTLEVHIPAIEDIVSAVLVGDQIERVDIVHFPVGNRDKRGDGSAQIDQCVAT